MYNRPDECIFCESPGVALCDSDEFKNGNTCRNLVCADHLVAQFKGDELNKGFPGNFYILCQDCKDQQIESRAPRG